MLFDVHDVPPNAKLEVPVCIAGAGAAGITLALRLAERGVDTMLLESGGHELEQDTQDLYKGHLVGSPYFQLQHTRLRYLGGSTNHWTGWCRPLDRTDFEPRRWLRYGNWPIDLEDLAPYYDLAHPICDLGPTEYSAEYWAARTGRPVLPLDPDLAQTVIWQFSTPTRFAQKYGRELAEAEHLTTYLHANVVDIEPDKRGRRVERIRVKALDGHELFVYPGVLVLAAGAIENARLLLASTQGNPAGLGNRYDVVGRYFMEHPHTDVGVLLTSPNDFNLDLYWDIFRLGEDAPPPAIRGALTTSIETRRREGLMGFSAALEPKVKYPPFGKALQSGVEQLIRDLQRVEPSNMYQLYLRGEQAPVPYSRVLLDDRCDCLGMRQAALAWHLDQESIASMRRSFEIIAAAIGRARVGRIYSFLHTGNEVRRGAWPEFTGGHHHMGTTRMGTERRYSVVDANCRMHDIDNLYVAGSSVFTTGGFSNPTLTIVALALRLADHLEHVL